MRQSKIYKYIRLKYKNDRMHKLFKYLEKNLIRI